MRHKTRVFEQLVAWRDDGIACVLAFVQRTEGSTYSKCGDFIVIAADGSYQGLVSGGCVEGDLALRAAQVAATGQSDRVIYDLGGDHDALWGMGAGCDGTLEIVLVSVADAFERVIRSAIANYLAGIAGVLVLPDAGSVGYVDEQEQDQSSVNLDDGFRQVADRQLHDRASTFVADSPDGASALYVFIQPAPRLLVCGAAPDALPLIEFADLLGWRTTVFDHRPAYIDGLVDRATTDQYCASASELAASVDLLHQDAVMVMSHHLDSDFQYLKAIGNYRHWHYVGLLGPRHRRDRLLARLDVDSKCYLEAVISGPAGMDIGGREPAVIALSIIAELQQVFNVAMRV
ncbi:MAG: XdhC family protein [Woeseiaceae bacterium]